MSAYNAGEPMGQTTLGLVVPYSPEYRAGGANLSLLDELARVTKGGPLEDPLAAFTHNLPAVDSAREVWSTLLLIVALLFPLDVAIRRVMLTPRDLQKAREWLKIRVTGHSGTQKREERLLNQLFSARERARRRTGVKQAASGGPVHPVSGEKTISPAPIQSLPAEPSSGGPKPENPAEEDALARLRAAKKRARKE